METREENGIIYYQNPHNLDWLEFAFRHLGCDAIALNDAVCDLKNVKIIAYAASKEKNHELYEVFKKNYGDGSYTVMLHIGEWEANGIA